MNEVKVPWIVKVLTGCVSQETAHVQEDYPYGFRLRCARRCWLEYDKKHGFRFCAQTSNPKRPGLVWNAPKKSTYARLAVLVLTDEHVDAAGNPAHVTWVTPGLYTNFETISAFDAAFHAGFDAAQLAIVAAAMTFFQASFDAKRRAPDPRRVTVTDAATGDAVASDVPMTHPAMVALMTLLEADTGMKYNPPVHYLSDANPVSVCASEWLGKRVRVQLTPGTAPAAT